MEVWKYPLKKMLAFATDGITSFSIKPIRMITTCGFMIFAISKKLVRIFNDFTNLRDHQIDELYGGGA